MDLGERINKSYFDGTITEKEWDVLLSIHLNTIRDITCPVTGRILDSQKSHLLKLKLNPDVISVDPENSETIYEAVVSDQADDEVIAQRLSNSDYFLVERVPNIPEAWERIWEK